MPPPPPHPHPMLQSGFRVTVSSVCYCTVHGMCEPNRQRTLLLGGGRQRRFAVAISKDGRIVSHAPLELARTFW